jgi:hypothetical protein
MRLRNLKASMEQQLQDKMKVLQTDMITHAANLNAQVGIPSACSSLSSLLPTAVCNARTRMPNSPPPKYSECRLDLPDLLVRGCDFS